MRLIDLSGDKKKRVLFSSFQTATSAEIRKAFRQLSVVLHPDKNDAEDANVQFRNLVAVYEVLKDPAKREK